MQEKEFDNLMAGKPSKMAFIPKKTALSRITKAFVKKNEVPAPRHIVSAVDIFVDRHRKLGMSEKNIRRRVLTKFKIAIV